LSIGIAMIASVYAPLIGGIQTQTRQLSRVLARRGARVTVITRHRRGLPREEQTDGFTVLRVGRDDASRAIATGSFLVDSLRAIAERRDEIDVIHAHQLLSPTTIALASRAFFGQPIVVNPHACGPIGDVAQLAETQGLPGRLRLATTRRFADAFISISRLIHAELRSVGVPEDRIVNIPNGVDTDLFSPANAAERSSLRSTLELPDGPLVVSAGRLSPEKGVDVLLAAWPRVVSQLPEATLLILGDGDQREALEQQSCALGIEQSVMFRGAVSDTVPYLRAADVFALPSRTKGLPVVLLEAMACGLPICATAAGGTPEVLTDGVTGRLVPSERPNTFGDALAALLQQGDSARISLGTAARAHVQERFSLDAMAEKTLRLYNQLLRSREAVAMSRAASW
jgi:glycosyltransferase involved in cell wall biosynthesis